MRAWLEIDGTRWASDDWPAAEDRRPVFKATLRPEGTRGPGEEWWFTEGVWKGNNPAPDYLLEVVRVETESEVEGRLQTVREEFARPLWGHPGEKWEHEFPPDPELARFLDLSWQALGGYGRESFRGEAGRWVLEAPFFNEEAEFNREAGGKTPDRETRSREDTETLLDAAVGPDAGLRAVAKGGREDWGGEFETLWTNARNAQTAREDSENREKAKKERGRRRIGCCAWALAALALAAWGMWGIDGVSAERIRQLTKEEKFEAAAAQSGEFYFFGVKQARVKSALEDNEKEREAWIDNHQRDFDKAMDERQWDEAVRIGGILKKQRFAPPELPEAEKLANAQRALADTQRKWKDRSRESMVGEWEEYKSLERDYLEVVRKHDPEMANQISQGVAKAEAAVKKWDTDVAAAAEAAKEQQEKEKREAEERRKREEDLRKEREARAKRDADEAEKARQAEALKEIHVLKARLENGREVSATIVQGLKTSEATTPKKVRVGKGKKVFFRLEYAEGGWMYVGEVHVGEASLGAEDGKEVVVTLSKAEAGKTSKTLVLPGGAKMELAWCPPGSFTMGSPSSMLGFGEAGRNDDETQHRVTLTNGFWMAKTEVTQKQWVSVMGSNPSYFNARPPDDLPVECVSWEDCQEFCKRTGLELPTEAQWEYACRAGTTGAYGGTGWLVDMGWYKSSNTQAVGGKSPNAWGLYDMHGNVFEWCADWYGDYPNGAVRNPKGASAGSSRVFRGGSWAHDADRCRSAFRTGDSPTNRYWDLGFRPVMALP